MIMFLLKLIFLYSKAFINHDKERRLKYIRELSNNKTKINSKALFLHEITNRYKKNMKEMKFLNLCGKIC